MCILAQRAGISAAALPGATDRSGTSGDCMIQSGNEKHKAQAQVQRFDIQKRFSVVRVRDASRVSF
jgi:hypothetical protein